MRTEALGKKNHVTWSVASQSVFIVFNVLSEPAWDSPSCHCMQPITGWTEQQTCGPGNAGRLEILFERKDGFSNSQWKQNPSEFSTHSAHQTFASLFFLRQKCWSLTTWWHLKAWPTARLTTPSCWMRRREGSWSGPKTTSSLLTSSISETMSRYTQHLSFPSVCLFFFFSL